MKKFIITLAVTMLTLHLSAPPIGLIISALRDGSLQISASGIVDLPPAKTVCVLESTTNLVNWTSINTNNGPFPISGTVLQIVQPTNSMTFYRAYVEYVLY